MTAGEGRGELGGARPPGWATAAGVAAALVTLYLLRYALLPVAFAAALAFVLHPLVRWMRHRLRVPQGAGALILTLAAAALAATAAWYAVAVAGDELVRGAADAPRALAALVERVAGPQFHLLGRDIAAEELARWIVDGAADAVGRPDVALLAAGALVGLPAVGVLMLVLLFYFLTSGPQLLAGALRLFPPRHRGHLAHLGRRVEPMLRRYLRGVLAVTLYTAVLCWLVLVLGFHAPFAPLIALAVGVLELVPVVGPAAAFALFGAVALADGRGPWAFAALMGLAVFLRVSVDNVVGPLVLGRAVTLHPVAVIVAFLVGGALFGVLGVFVAVPAAAAVKIALGVWYGEEERGDAAG